MSFGEALLQLPQRSGAYRWFYADVSDGSFTAVFIFMVGSVFSPRYSAGVRRGALPGQHVAVNFALYERGARWLWVLTEYASLAQAGRVVKIGASRLELPAEGGARASVVDRTAPWGKPVHATLELHPESPRGPELALVEGEPHWWQPLAPLARATVTVPSHGVRFTGPAYLDTNHGAEPLGGGLEGWSWTRLHRPGEAFVSYAPNRAPTHLHVHASAQRVQVERVPAVPMTSQRTGWGLAVPRRLSAGPIGLDLEPSLLETSPFYARLEARQHDAHALGEVANFRRFALPQIRWMAHFRSRVGSAEAAP